MPQFSTFFSKPTRLTIQKDCSPYEWFDSTHELRIKLIPPHDSFYDILRNSIPLENDYNEFENLVQSGSSREKALAKLRMDNVPPTGAENYANLQNIWDYEHIQFFADFLKWYNNTYVFRAVETMQKFIEFYHNEKIDMLKLGFQLSNLVKEI